jgi:hypothetical protein
MANPDLKQTLDALKNQVLVGKAYLLIGKGLLDSDPVIRQTAPTFFGLTLDGSLELAQITAARLYDTTAGTITVTTVLRMAEQQAGLFQRGNAMEVRAAIKQAEQKIAALEPILESIRLRRNEWFAHLAPDTVRDPKALAERAQLTIPDLDRVYSETEELLTDLACLYEGTFGELRYIGHDDYKMALKYIRDAKCAQIKEYEKEFGAWPGPRPKD